MYFPNVYLCACACACELDRARRESERYEESLYRQECAGEKASESEAKRERKIPREFVFTRVCTFSK